MSLMCLSCKNFAIISEENGGPLSVVSLWGFHTGKLVI